MDARVDNFGRQKLPHEQEIHFLESERAFSINLSSLDAVRALVAQKNE